jgi:hypothetical protein
MNDDPINVFAEDDPELDKLLAPLPHIAPSPGFADRVLSRVWRPAPPWAQRVTHWAAGAFGAQHRWEWAGALAACSAFGIVVSLTLAVNFRMQIETAWSALVAGVLVEWWRVALQWSVDGIHWAMGTGVFGWSGPTLVAMALTCACVVVTSAWGLHRTIRAYVTTER